MIYFIGILIAAILSLGGIASCEHKEVRRLEAEMKAIQIESDRLTKARQEENKKALEGYIQYARENTDEYEKTIAILRGAAKSGSVFHDKSCPAGGQSTAGSTGTPEKPPIGQGIVLTPREVALGEPEVASILGWYVYAESCHKFVKPLSIRQSLRGTQ